MEWNCARGHRSCLPCAKAKGACRFCDEEDRTRERKRQRDLLLDAERQRKQKEYAQRLAEAQDELAHMRRVQRDAFADAEQKKILQRHQEEIDRLKDPSKKVGSDIRTTLDPAPCENQPVVAASNQANQTIAVPQGSKGPLPQKPKPTPTPKPSASKDDWAYQKQFLNAQSKEIDILIQMLGLESVKAKFLAIKAKVDTAVRQGVDLKSERFGSVLLGNPGTGKTTVARLYASFLHSVGIVPGETVVETTGSKLANDGVSGCRKALEGLLNKGGGAIFIDEAYQLVQGSNFGGAAVLDFLLAEVENLTGKVVFILAGYTRPMENFFSHNTGLPSRFPHELKFDDFDDEELRQILSSHIERFYGGKMKVEDGLDGLYCRIVARRIGRGRGQEGFANARAIENSVAKIKERQSERLNRDRRSSKGAVDDFVFSKEDLIGPEPSQAATNSKAWRELQAMVGLDEVKKTVAALLGTIQCNYQRELSEQPPVDFTLNKVFLGSPGTGKTTVAKLYGQILVDLGLLSSDEGMY